MGNNKGKIIVYSKSLDKEKMIDKKDLQKYLDNGFIKGRKPFSDEHKQKIGNANKGNESLFKGKKRPKEICEKISKTKTGRKDSPEKTRINSECHKGMKWYNNGVKELCTKSIPPKGFRPGRLPMSKEQKSKLSKAHKGKQLSKQQLKIRASKEYLTKKKNDSFNKSKPEQDLYEELLSKYQGKTIYRQYKDEQRYPFYCDFYIEEDDLFIELNAHWTHGGKPFDENDEECIEQLNKWKEKAKTSKFYENAIKTWTVRDVEKQRIAKENHLNYKVIY